ncbi:unnamed protein product, partial [Cylicostephanus goldi]
QPPPPAQRQPPPPVQRQPPPPPPRGVFIRGPQPLPGFPRHRREITIYA